MLLLFRYHIFSPATFDGKRYILLHYGLQETSADDEPIPIFFATAVMHHFKYLDFLQ